MTEKSIIFDQSSLQAFKKLLTMAEIIANKMSDTAEKTTDSKRDTRLTAANTIATTVAVSQIICEDLTMITQTLLKHDINKAIKALNSDEPIDQNDKKVLSYLFSDILTIVEYANKIDSLIYGKETAKALGIKAPAQKEGKQANQQVRK